jgi:hypothetical protein
MAFLAPSKLPILRRNIKTYDNIQGADIGIPLNIITNLFTNLHYGKEITTPYIVSLQFLIGYYTYGKDRYKDALEYESAPYETSSTKQELYMSILKYRYISRLSYCICFYAILYSLNDQLTPGQYLPIMGLLYSTEYYKQFKTNIPAFKPFYVSLLWTFATCILPCLIHDHDYSILADPYDYLPCALNLFAFTNLADIKDIEEDRINNVKTFPLLFGEDVTYMSIFFALASSSLLFGLHPHYMDRPLINSLFEVQNIVLSILCAGLKFKRVV